MRIALASDHAGTGTRCCLLLISEPVSYLVPAALNQGPLVCGLSGTRYRTASCGNLAIMEVTSMKKADALLSALLAVFMLSSAAPARYTGEPVEEDSQAMKPSDLEYGKRNPNAPPELSRFAFLIGKWGCDAKLRREDRTWESLNAIWEGRYILDGYAIADEYRMTTPAGELVVLGMNFRSYDANKKTWNLKWLNALAGTWVDLGSEDLGGVKADGKTITYSMKEPLAAHRLTRATYTNNSKSHFTWRGERSNDGKEWDEFLVIQCYRRKK